MRAAVVLRYYADLPVEEVAKALGKSPNTIKAQLQTALDRLRTSLADSGSAPDREARHA
jgi:RNA polymerase sigma factor (sigma-70 family)